MITEEIFTQAVSHRERLAGFLSEYRRFSGELADLERKIAEAKANEESALNDHSADEAEIADRITKTQNLQRVHASRLEHKRAQVFRSSKAGRIGVSLSPKVSLGARPVSC